MNADNEEIVVPNPCQIERDVYATRADYELLLCAVEEKFSLKYLLTDGSPTPMPPTFFSGSDLPNIGVAVHGNVVLEPDYLVVPSSMEVKARRVELYAGGERYFVDQDGNPASITFRPAGLYQNTCIIKGDFGTISLDPFSKKLFQCFAREVRKNFTCIAGFWVGPEALRLFEGGMRLTYDVRSRSDDLKAYMKGASTLNDGNRTNYLEPIR